MRLEMRKYNIFPLISSSNTPQCYSYVRIASALKYLNPFKLHELYVCKM